MRNIFAFASSEWLRSFIPTLLTICLGLGVLVILFVFVWIFIKYKNRPHDEFKALLTSQRKPK